MAETQIRIGENLALGEPPWADATEPLFPGAVILESAKIGWSPDESR
jgi:hypothetical protein